MPRLSLLAEEGLLVDCADLDVVDALYVGEVRVDPGVGEACGSGR